MGIVRIKQQDHNNVYYTEFAIDDEEDVAALPTAPNEVGVGSAAICIGNSEVYMLNSKRKWVKL